MTALALAPIVETVDQLDGTRVPNAVLSVRHITRLTCGCTRYSCNRPGGGLVEVVRGDHCQPSAEGNTPPARSSPALLAVPA